MTGGIDIKTECFMLRQSLKEGGEAFVAMSALKTEVENSPSSPQLVTGLVVEKNSDQLTVKAGENLSATCTFKNVGLVTFASNEYNKRDSNSGVGDANDEGYVCDVTMTGAINVGGTSPSDQLSFVWLKGRAGMSGKDKSKSKKEAAPGYSWYYKERTWGNWTAWKGSSAAFSPSFTGFSASVTGCSIGVKGVSLSANGIEVVISVFKDARRLTYKGFATCSLLLKGLSFKEKLSAVYNYCKSSSTRASYVENCAVKNNA